MSDDEFFLVNDREVVITPHMHVKCDGGNRALGHPMEYMTLAQGGHVACGYCGRRYVHTDNPEAEGIRADGRRYAA